MKFDFQSEWTFKNISRKGNISLEEKIFLITHLWLEGLEHFISERKGKILTWETIFSQIVI